VQPDVVVLADFGYFVERVDGAREGRTCRGNHGHGHDARGDVFRKHLF
jgi:hypothetical protein